MSSAAKLMFLCGKMAAGKSTLARDLAEREDAILLVQDDFLEHLWPGEITDIPEFIDRSRRLRKALWRLSRNQDATQELHRRSARFGAMGDFDDLIAANKSSRRTSTSAASTAWRTRASRS